MQVARKKEMGMPTSTPIVMNTKLFDAVTPDNISEVSLEHL